MGSVQKDSKDRDLPKRSIKCTKNYGTFRNSLFELRLNDSDFDPEYLLKSRKLEKVPRYDGLGLVAPLLFDGKS